MRVPCKDLGVKRKRSKIDIVQPKLFLMFNLDIYPHFLSESDDSDNQLEQKETKVLSPAQQKQPNQQWYRLTIHLKAIN